VSFFLGELKIVCGGRREGGCLFGTRLSSVAARLQVSAGKPSAGGGALPKKVQGRSLYRVPQSGGHKVLGSRKTTDS
jgi:hypothetical protein